MSTNPSLSSNEKISFSPMHKGLGFHHFTDTLNSNKTINPPVTKVSLRQPPPPVQRPSGDAYKKPSLNMALKETQAAPSIEKQQVYGFLYLTKRMFAFLFDTALNFSLCLGAFLLVLLQINIDFNPLLTLDVMAVTFLFLCVFNWILITSQEIAFHTSIGKKMFSLTLKGDVTQIFLRSFYFLISFGFLLGIFWSLFDRKKRCLHDIFVDLQPQEVAEI